MINWLLNKLGYIRKSDVVSDTPQVEIKSLSEKPTPIKAATKFVTKKPKRHYGKRNIP